MLKKLSILTLSILLVCNPAYATQISYSKTFVDGETLNASDLETMKSDITDVVNAGGGPVGLTNSQTISGNNTFSGANTHSGNVTITGTLTTTSTTTLGNAAGDTLTLTGDVTANSDVTIGASSDWTYTSGSTMTGSTNASGLVLGGASPLQFEGTSSDANQTFFNITNPTADRIFTFPNISATIGQSVTEINTATRLLDAGNGAVSYTGCGFEPTSLLIFTAPTGSLKSLAFGQSDNSLEEHGIRQVNNGTADIMAGKIVDMEDANGRDAAVLTSYDADGFTLTWTAVSSPDTTTVTLHFMCIR